MDREQWLGRIPADPRVLAGKPAIRGMRISVEQILGALAAGVPEQEWLVDYPAMEPDDIRAALLFARDMDTDYGEMVYGAGLAHAGILLLRPWGHAAMGSARAGTRSGGPSPPQSSGLSAARGPAGLFSASIVAVEQLDHAQGIQRQPRVRFARPAKVDR
jgi:uncharacterized protein (DUF433 family)